MSRLNPRRFPWRWVLSALQVALAITLLIGLQVEKNKHEAQLKAQWTNNGWHLMGEFDYVPRSFNLLIIADFPVLVASAPMAAVIKSSLVVRLLFVLLVSFFWYWVGRGIERRWNEKAITPKLPLKYRLAGNVTGFVVSGSVLATVLLSGSGTPSLLVYGATIVWSAGFTGFFALKLAKVWLSRRLFQ